MCVGVDFSILLKKMNKYSDSSRQTKEETKSNQFRDDGLVLVHELLLSQGKKF